jgi:putative tricarboxylic transport membrane protein
MRLSDRLSGLVAGTLGLAVILYARTFPPMPGQNVGPALFPTLVGTGLVAFGIWLVVSDRSDPPVPFFTVDSWVRQSRLRANVALVVGALVAYILLVEPVGFFLTSIAFLSVLMLAFGAARRWVVPTVVVVTLVLHYGFYSLLRVPLPWGIFQGVAW